MADQLAQGTEPSATPAAPGTPDYIRALDEYKEASTNFRLYADLRFKQLTLFAVITAALLTAYPKDEVRLVGFQFWLSVLGLVTCAAFWILEDRATRYRRGYIERAKSLESKLGFAQIRATKLQKDRDHILDSQFALAVLFIVATVVWLVAFFRST